MKNRKAKDLIKALGQAALAGALCLSATGCDQGAASNGKGAGQITQPLENTQPEFNPNELLAKGLAHEAPGIPVARPDDGAPSAVPLTKAAAASADINFSDPNALSLIPNINETFVYWPGYIQSIGNSTWLYVWRSVSGPGSSLIPYTTPGAHFHIVYDNPCLYNNNSTFGILINNVCGPVPASTNRYQMPMFGNDWLALYAQTNSGRVNFDLTGIRVKGTVPISLWYKNASGWFYWNSLGPNNWSLPGATNISEVEIAATSRGVNDKYMTDDIMIAPR